MMINLNDPEWGYLNGSFDKIRIIYSTITLPQASETIQEKKMKKPRIIIHPSKCQFRYGNCASIAICSAFEIEWRAFKLICFLLKLNPHNGLNFYECKKLINLLSKHYDIKVNYISNHGKVKYYQMVSILNKGKYITMFHNHLSFVENGEVFDYFYQNDEKAEMYIPTGWWKLD